MLDVWTGAFEESGYGDEAEAGMTRLMLPKEVDWKGDHESLEAFLTAIENACPISHHLLCGTKKESDCGLCAAMRDQKILDTWLWLKKLGLSNKNRYVAKEGSWD